MFSQLHFNEKEFYKQKRHGDAAARRLFYILEKIKRTEAMCIHYSTDEGSARIADRSVTELKILSTFSV